jgi:D-glucosaminate-specific PTS system IIB component
MGNLTQVRIDSRLIHGQVVVEWIRHLSIESVLIVDDQIASDHYLEQVFRTAAPYGIRLELMDMETAAKKWREDALGQGNTLAMFRDIPSAYAAYKQGFTFPKLQVGGTGVAPTRIPVVGPITLIEADAMKLSEMAKSGCDITFQVLPNTPEVSFEKVRSNFFPHC